MKIPISQEEIIKIGEEGFIAGMQVAAEAILAMVEKMKNEKAKQPAGKADVTSPPQS